MLPETKKEQELAKLRSMSRSGKVEPVKMPEAFDLELYVYFGPSMIKFVGNESKAEAVMGEIVAQTKTWFAEPGLGAKIIVIPTIKKLKNDTLYIDEWREMLPRENHKKGRLHALIVANTSIGGSVGGPLYASGMAYVGTVCGKKHNLEIDGCLIKRLRYFYMLEIKNFICVKSSPNELGFGINFIE